jgi:Fe-S cluster assembly ATP-binding protein
MALLIENLQVQVGDKQILRGLSLTVEPGKVHALMGPNGSGKSTLANTLMGHPGYVITGGSIRLDEVELKDLSPDERAKAGLFLSFQYPVEIPGVSLLHFLRTADAALHSMPATAVKFREQVSGELESLQMPKEFLKRSVNEGFSGGEKKRAEIAQLKVLKPKYAILDETDSGLDVDALRVVAESVKVIRQSTGILLITHYPRVLQYLPPDYVHVLVEGRIVASGGPELATEIDRDGYKKFLAQKDAPAL